jgi:hypothetical protein
VPENRKLRRIGPEKAETVGGWRKLVNAEE